MELKKEREKEREKGECVYIPICFVFVFLCVCNPKKKEQQQQKIVLKPITTRRESKLVGIPLLLTFLTKTPAALLTLSV